MTQKLYSIMATLFAAYKKDRWTVSSIIGIVGCGGFVEYKQGVPSTTSTTS